MQKYSIQHYFDLNFQNVYSILSSSFSFQLFLNTIKMYYLLFLIWKYRMLKLQLGFYQISQMIYLIIFCLLYLKDIHKLLLIHQKKFIYKLLQ